MADALDALRKKYGITEAAKPTEAPTPEAPLTTTTKGESGGIEKLAAEMGIVVTPENPPREFKIGPPRPGMEVGYEPGTFAGLPTGALGQKYTVAGKPVKWGDLYNYVKKEYPSEQAGPILERVTEDVLEKLPESAIESISAWPQTGFRLAAPLSMIGPAVTAGFETIKGTAKTGDIFKGLERGATLGAMDAALVGGLTALPLVGSLALNNPLARGIGQSIKDTTRLALTNRAAFTDKWGAALEAKAFPEVDKAVTAALLGGKTLAKNEADDAAMLLGGNFNKLPDLVSDSDSLTKTVKNIYAKAGDDILNGAPYIETERAIETARSEALRAYAANKIGTNFPQYQREIIAGMDKLPEFNMDLDAKPNIPAYNNWYTKPANELLSRLTSNVAKTPLGELTVYDGRNMAGLNALRARLHYADGLYAYAKKHFIEPLVKLPAGEKEAVGLMMFKELPPTGQWFDFIKKSDKFVASLGNELLNVKKEWQKLPGFKEKWLPLADETWQNNVGKYYRTIYVDKAMKRAIPPTPGGIKMGMFKRKLTNEDWANIALERLGRSASEYTPSQLRMLGLEEKSTHGWITLGDVVMDTTTRDLVDNVAWAKYINGVLNHPDLFSLVPKEGFVKASDIVKQMGGATKMLLKEEGDDPVMIELMTNKLGPLVNGYIHPGIAQDIPFFMTKSKESNLERALGIGLKYWKTNMTARSPGGTFRNYISGTTVQNDFAGYPIWYPKNWKTFLGSVKDFFANGEAKDFWLKRGLFGSDFQTIELDKAFASRFDDIADYTGYTSTWLDKIDKLSQIDRPFTKYYNLFDQINRMYLANSAMRDGLTAEQAVAFANKWQLDYRIVPKFIEGLRQGKTGMGAFAPFASFTYLMSPRVLEVLATRPFTLLKYPLMFEAFNAMSRHKLGISKTLKREKDEEWAPYLLRQAKHELKTRDVVSKLQPDFLSGSRWQLILPWLQDNQVQTLDLSYNLPFGGGLFTGFIDPMNLLSMMKGGGPYQTIQNIINNHDPYFNKPIHNSPNNNPELQDPKKWEKIMAYAARGLLSPRYLTDIERLWSAYRGEQYGYPFERDRSIEQAWMRPVGISVYSGGVDEWKKQLEIATTQRDFYKTTIGQIQRNVNLSDKEKSKQRKFYMKEVLRLNDYMAELERMAGDAFKYIPESFGRQRRPK